LPLPVRQVLQLRSAVQEYRGTIYGSVACSHFHLKFGGIRIVLNGWHLNTPKHRRLNLIILMATVT
jgi:hypothetical protein